MRLHSRLAHGRRSLLRRAAGLATALLATPAAALVIDFEGAPGADDQVFIQALGSNFYQGLDWSNPNDLSGASDWEINTDNDPFASFGGGSYSLQGFAEGDNNRAKLGWNGSDPFEFVSMALRTRFAEDDPVGLIDGNADGVDDRWLTSLTVTFRDVNNLESLAVVNLDVVANDWVLLTAAMLAGAADPTQIKAVFFTGDSGTTVAGVKNDRFAIDNLTIIPVPEPGTAVLLGLGLLALGVRRRR